MPSHHESRRLPYTPEQMFDLVADVGRYAEFLPWVAATRVRARDAAQLTADMVVGFGPFREQFTSRVTLDPPRALHVEYLSGPLKYLRNEWRFRPVEDGTCLDFSVEFEFKNRTFERLAGAVFQEAFRRMVAAFERRANALYGRASSPASGIKSSSAQITA